MRKLILTAMLAVLPFTAQAEYEKGLTKKQMAIRDVLLENYTLMNRDVQAKVRDLISQAETAGRAGKEREADQLIAQAMMVVAEQMFIMNANKSDG